MHKHTKAQISLVICGLIATVALCTRSQAKPAAKAVGYHVYTSYFESNQSGLRGTSSFLAFNKQSDFDKVFGAAAMSRDNSFLPDDAFKSKGVVAVIKRGHNTWKYTVQTVKALGGTLTIRYKATAGASGPSATFASPLIIALDRKISGPVVFIENGVRVGKATVSHTPKMSAALAQRTYSLTKPPGLSQQDYQKQVRVRTNSPKPSHLPKGQGGWTVHRQ